MHHAKVLAAAATLLPLPFAGAVESGLHGEYADKCPLACTADPGDWIRYIRFELFKTCDQPLIIQYNTDAETVDSTLAMRACPLSPAAKVQADHVFVNNHIVAERSPKQLRLGWRDGRV
jgi:hypothetical protein